MRQRRRNQENGPERAEIEREEVREEVRVEERVRPEQEEQRERIPLDPDQVQQVEHQVRGNYLGRRVEQAHQRGRKYRDGLTMTAAELQASLRDVQARVEHSIAQSTEATYVNTMARFERFCLLHLPNEKMTFELKVMIWCEFQIANLEITVQCALQYCKNLSAGLQKMGKKVIGMEMYMQGLRKSGALAPDRQAAPMMKDQLYHLLDVMNQDGMSHERVHLILMWFTASRFDDVEKLMTSKVEKERCLEDTRVQWNVRYDVHKGDPFHLGASSKMILPSQLSLFLDYHITRRRPDEKLTAATYSQVNHAIQSIFPDLSCHSIKRGALLELLKAGVPMETLQVIAKHRNMKTLLVYLDSARVADALGLSEAAMNL